MSFTYTFEHERGEPKFTAKEEKIVNPLKAKGWEFRFEDDYDYHNNVSDGYYVQIKSPRMREFRNVPLSSTEELNKAVLLEVEIKYAAECVVDNMHGRAKAWIEGVVQEYIRQHPKKKLHDLFRVEMEEFVDNTCGSE